jgi:hypothetical protein
LRHQGAGAVLVKGHLGVLMDIAPDGDEFLNRCVVDACHVVFSFLPVAIQNQVQHAFLCMLKV